MLLEARNHNAETDIDCKLETNIFLEGNEAT